MLYAFAYLIYVKVLILNGLLVVQLQLKGIHSEAGAGGGGGVIEPEGDINVSFDDQKSGPTPTP